MGVCGYANADCFHEWNIFLFHLSLGTMSPSAALRLATWQHFCFGLRTINRRTLHINTANWPIHYLAFMTRILNCQPFSVNFTQRLPGWHHWIARVSFFFFRKCFKIRFAHTYWSSFYFYIGEPRRMSDVASQTPRKQPDPVQAQSFRIPYSVPFRSDPIRSDPIQPTSSRELRLSEAKRQRSAASWKTSRLPLTFPHTCWPCTVVWNRVKNVRIALKIPGGRTNASTISANCECRQRC